MAVFEINGKKVGSLGEALDLCREIWAEHKAQAVAEQLDAVKHKKDDLAAARAAQGVDVESMVLPDGVASEAERGGIVASGEAN